MCGFLCSSNLSTFDLGPVCFGLGLQSGPNQRESAPGVAFFLLPSVRKWPTPSKRNPSLPERRSIVHLFVAKRPPPVCFERLSEGQCLQFAPSRCCIAFSEKTPGPKSRRRFWPWKLFSGLRRSGAKAQSVGMSETWLWNQRLKPAVCPSSIIFEPYPHGFPVPLACLSFQCPEARKGGGTRSHELLPLPLASVRASAVRLRCISGKAALLTKKANVSCPSYPNWKAPIRHLSPGTLCKRQ